MNEAVETISQAAVAMVQAGGPYAVIIFVVVFVVPTMIKWGTFAWVFGKICSVVQAWLESEQAIRAARAKQEQTRFSLLSEQVSARVSSTMSSLDSNIERLIGLLCSLESRHFGTPAQAANTSAPLSEPSGSGPGEPGAASRDVGV